MAENGHGSAAGGDANENAAGGGANANAGGGGANGGLNPRDLNELEKFADLVISRQTELGEHRDKTEQMGWFGQWWDAKVPTSFKRIYNFVSLNTGTDKNKISGDIQTYRNFYRELHRVAEALRQAAQEGNVDADDILQLYNRLSQMLEEAEAGQNTTNSSTLYAIHQQFIATQEPLENMIRRVECVALRQQLRQVTQAWREAHAQINEMRLEMQRLREDNREIQRRLDDITSTSQQMAENQQLLLQQNETMTRLLRDFFDRQ